jgi:hypothetical protein
MATTTNGLSKGMCLALHTILTEGAGVGFTGSLEQDARDLATNGLATRDNHGGYTATEAGEAAYTDEVAAVAERMILAVRIANEER